jgi:hypothetical protein
VEEGRDVDLQVEVAVVGLERRLVADDLVDVVAAVRPATPCWDSTSPFTDTRVPA